MSETEQTETIQEENATTTAPAPTAAPATDLEARVIELSMQLVAVQKDVASLKTKSIETNESIDQTDRIVARLVVSDMMKTLRGSRERETPQSKRQKNSNGEPSRRVRVVVLQGGKSGSDSKSSEQRKGSDSDDDMPDFLKALLAARASKCDSDSD